MLDKRNRESTDRFRDGEPDEELRWSQEGKLTATLLLDRNRETGKALCAGILEMLVGGAWLDWARRRTSRERSVARSDGRYQFSGLCGRYAWFLGRLGGQLQGHTVHCTV